MKKWMNYIAIAGLTAGTASAAWWPFGSDKKAEPAPSVTPAAAPEMPQMRKHDGMGEHQRPPISPEQMEKMKAQHEALMKLGDMARNETDPVKKEAIVADIRVKVTEMVDNAHAEMKKRLDQAEKELPKLKQKLAEAEKDKAARIEEHVQKIIAGEMPNGPEGKRPDGALKKEGKKEGKKLAPPPVE